jgi:succinate dehydrogenase/fumarate reductase flavoprotein subunit
MSSDEEKAVIGGIVLEYGEVKRRLVALEAEANRMGRALEKIGILFRSPAQSVQTRSTELNSALTELPERKNVVDTVEEIRAAIKRRDELQKSIKQYGLEV